jgi:hypothetical protein
MFENKLQVLSSLENIPNNKFGMLNFFPSLKKNIGSSKSPYV